VAADYLKRPNRGEKPRLYHNNGDGTFTNVARQAHLDTVVIGMASNFGDLDNDGWLDFYVGTGQPDLGMIIPNRMFRNAEGGYFGCSPLRQEIGLGNAVSVERVEVLWPVPGATQSFSGFQMDHFYRLRQGDAAPVPWPVRSFTLSHAPPEHHHHVMGTAGAP